MITLSDNLKSTSVNEIWAVRIYYDDTTTKNINLGTNGIGVINTAGRLALIDVSGSIGTYNSIPPLVARYGKKYNFNFPNISDNSIDTDYGISISSLGQVFTETPANLTFTGQTTDQIDITPIRPYFTLATAPFIDSDNEYYDPVITKVGSIRDKIDIIKGRSKTSNLSITIADNSTTGRSSSSALTYKNLFFKSDKNFAGTSIINRECEIYSVTPESDTMTRIYTGRVSNLSMKNGEIVIKVMQEQPFTNRTIPSEKDSNGILNAIAYGDYENNVATNNYTGRILFPIPYAFSADRYKRNFYTLPKNLISYNNVVPHYYDKASQKYFPLTDTTFNNLAQDTANDGEHYYSVIDSSYSKNCIIKANINEAGVSDTGASGIVEGTISAPEMTNSSINNTFDNPSSTNETTTYGGCHHRVQYTADSFSPDYSLITAYPNNQSPIGSIDIATGYSHKLQSNVTIKVTYSHVDRYVVDHPSDPENQYQDTGGLDNMRIILADATNHSRKDTILQFTNSYFTSNGGTHTPTQVSKDVSKTTYENTSKPSIRFTIPEFSANGITGESYDFYYTCRFYDIILEFKTAIDQSDQEQIESAIQRIENLYVGVDGIKKSWDTANIANKPHEIHRDLLFRECGITATPQGWSDISTARSSFNARYWINEETSLEKVLEKLQEEGGFIFRYNALGQPSYLYVKDSYTSSDVVATIDKNDISSISSSVTNVKDMITKIKFNYDLDPATRKTYNEAEFTKNESRSKFNLQTKEQVYEKTLDMIVDTAGVTALSNYLFNIASQPKVIVDIEVINYSLLGLEIGDIVQLHNELADDVVGLSSLTGRYFMIVSLNRNLGKGLKLQLREVYQQ